jgi:peptidoglycan/LPS O-acetylase OafA/YrhL
MPQAHDDSPQGTKAHSFTNISEWMSSVHLDFIRGLAALSVLLYHIRYRFFLDYSDLVTPDLSAKLYYGCTSFGHDAVMVFFVLSGFFIASSIRRDLLLDRWSWSRYASNRLVRLYVVLLPALGLTLFWDWLGIRLAGAHAIYTGLPQSWTHDFFNVSERLGPSVFFGNVCFLQTIYVPPLGSNDPLWSLSYEFWYYLLFPLILVGLFRSPGIYRKLAFAAMTTLVLLVVNRQILLYFPIWLIGAAIAWAPPVKVLTQRSVYIVVAILSLVTFVLATVSGHIGLIREYLGYSTLLTDYLTAIGFSFLLYVLLHDTRHRRMSAYTVCSKTLADMSYTLYAVHMPLLVFLRSQWITDRPWEPTAVPLLISSCLVVLCVVYAFVLSRFTETRTEIIRDWVLAMLHRKRESTG